jgi:uncharacterized membrane protein YcgQ (UPF0703/DUF1980 family)
MKKIIYIIVIIMILFTGCSGENKEIGAEQQSSEQSDGNDFETVIDHILDEQLKESNKATDEIIIRDKLFIAQCNDIYLNPDEYLDKNIRWEGIYTEAVNPNTNETYKFVIRYGPGCCGNDGTAGFEVLYDKDTPNVNDWVEVVGKIEMVEEDGNEFIAVRLSEIKVLDVRGQEFVSN